MANPHTYPREATDLGAGRSEHLDCTTIKKSIVSSPNTQSTGHGQSMNTLKTQSQQIDTAKIQGNTLYSPFISFLWCLTCHCSHAPLQLKVNCSICMHVTVNRAPTVVRRKEFLV